MSECNVERSPSTTVCVCIASFHIAWLHFWKARVSWALVFGIAVCRIAATGKEVLC